MRTGPTDRASGLKRGADASTSLFEFVLPNYPRIDGAGFQVVPREGELVHFLTGEAPRSVYRVAEVQYVIGDDMVRVDVILK